MSIDADSLVEFRRDLHRHPEPAFCEFYTTARIVEALSSRDVDELFVGPDAIDGEERLSVPDEAQLEEWSTRAVEAGADPDVVADLEGGHTGAVAVVRQGEGPTVGLRVDIDGLPIVESEDGDHVPAREGFRSENEGWMHACGHDAHATLGLGVIDAIRDSEFEGTLKVFFQPAEEHVGGAAPMVAAGHCDDVDYLYAVHVGLDHPTGEIVAGVNGFLAVSGFEVEFTGSPAHAGGHPEAGDNAIQALATAIENMYAVPRHADGATRVNAGVVEGGTASNIVAETARMECEVRGETTELMEYMWEKTGRVVETAAEMHGCEAERSRNSRAPSAVSDEGLARIVAEAAAGVEGVTNVVDTDDLGGSEDASYLMQAVQDDGGQACYVGLGTDHPGGHHTRTFDVDEESLTIGVETLSRAIVAVSKQRP